MDVGIWSDISRIADTEFDGDVNAAMEHVCRNGIAAIGENDEKNN